MTEDEESASPSLIHYLRSRRISTLAMLQTASLERLVLFDEEEDAISPPNRLLLNYPGLHEFVADISNHWAEECLDTKAEFSRIVHMFEEKSETDELQTDEKHPSTGSEVKS